MINDIFRDFINKEDVVTFIDNVLVKIETEEEYDKLIEEILKRMKENDLYIKPKKYMWKIREMEFFRVIMESDGIKIEKKKVRRMLE